MIQSYFPHDPRFSHEEFGDQPIWLIQQALREGERLQYQRLHYQEIGMSQLTSLYYNSKIDPKKTVPKAPDDFQAFGRLLENLYDKPSFTPQAANTIKYLLKSALMPPWLFRMLDMSLIDRTADGGEPGSPMAWSAYFHELDSGIAVVCPEIRGDTLYAPFAAVGNYVEGAHQLYVLGTRHKACKVNISSEQSGSVLMGDVEFEVVP